MFFLLPYVFLLVRGMPARPTEQTASATQKDLQPFFQVVMQDPQEANSNLSCVELRAQRLTLLHLKSRNLLSFPSCLPEILEHLDLSNNLLPEFNGQEAAYLPNLQALSLRQNQIRQVTWGPPGSLARLRSLDLSFNLLSSVPACNASTLGDLEELSLAGNPIEEIQTFAFSCCPQLRSLNLSSTLLGQGGSGGIQDSAFAVNVLQGDTTEMVGSALGMLDLSATLLERVRLEWLKDLPSLTSLHLTKMSRLRSLNAAVFAYTPQLEELNCRDSPVLSQVETESFGQTPKVAFLMFQNCNLSSLNPWNLSSSDNLVISLYGNPLECHCEMSWLLSEPERIVLQRASETMCSVPPEDNVAPRSIPLPRLYDECQSNRTTDSSPELTTGSLYSTSSRFATDTPPDFGTFPQEWHSSSAAPHSIALTWGDLTTQDSTQADMLAYKEETVNGSQESPLATAALTAASTILGKTSAKQTVENATKMDPRSHDPTTADYLVRPGGTLSHSALSTPTAAPTRTTADYLVRPEGTLSHSALSTPTAAPTRIDSSPVPSALFIPQNMPNSTPTKPPVQNSTKSPALPNPASTDVPVYYVDEYDYEGHQEGSEVQTLGPCAYDPCRHLQKPCSELQELSPCLCPGISDEFTVPEPPRLREASEIRDTSAEIRWCAPNSYVRFYRLTYHLKGNLNNSTVTGEIYPTAREYTLYNLQPGSSYQVCIAASNKAGSSQTTGWNGRRAPCITFATKPSYKSSFAILSAISGLLLLATVLMSGCLCKKHKAPPAEQYNTHLVSYKNPAFDNSSK
ncbi:PREDICTED: leucine-rich repeat neuronal protein 4 [Gekko japonicus]|uniref:Leucine-rich repeat neuronal protein 4 n=1 Tax=Gekko japonicus TaxID=146911 RepID=A0ABM1KGY4_GEKJA|nr:PREDICTED: leucine-rich repeat neuronal protein 4 [Gekko japonicus]